MRWPDFLLGRNQSFIQFHSLSMPDSSSAGKMQRSFSWALAQMYFTWAIWTTKNVVNFNIFGFESLWCHLNSLHRADLLTHFCVLTALFCLLKDLVPEGDLLAERTGSLVFPDHVSSRQVCARQTLVKVKTMWSLISESYHTMIHRTPLALLFKKDLKKYLRKEQNVVLVFGNKLLFSGEAESVTLGIFFFFMHINRIQTQAFFQGSLVFGNPWCHLNRLLMAAPFESPPLHCVITLDAYNLTPLPL